MNFWNPILYDVREVMVVHKKKHLIFKNSLHDFLKLIKFEVILQKDMSCKEYLIIFYERWFPLTTGSKNFHCTFAALFRFNLLDKAWTELSNSDGNDPWSVIVWTLQSNRFASQQRRTSRDFSLFRIDEHWVRDYNVIRLSDASQIRPRMKSEGETAQACRT